MQFTHIWNKFNLYGYKIACVSLLCFVMNAAVAQLPPKRYAEKNNPNYDNRKLSYGFVIGLHTTSYQLKYADRFVTPDFEDIHSIVPSWKYGFAIGFLVNRRLNDYLDLRVTPKVAFNEHEITYRYLDKPSVTRLIETTVVEFPLLLKYKSERRGNVRMYMVGGVKPGIEASGQKDKTNMGTLEVKGSNLSLDAGFGFDLYYPLFKFSPEIRFSHGVVNMLENTTNEFGAPLKRVNTNTITIYFVFQ